MGTRMPVTADDIDAAVICVLDALRPAVDEDWDVPAGTLEWTCRDTAEHIGQAHMHWASQLAVQARTRYMRWVSRAQPLAPPAGVLDFVDAAGRILTIVVRASPPDLRAFHPHGIADPEGFAGMACVEALIHGHDIATGLGLSLDPPMDVCERVLARMFPHYVARLAGVDADPWLSLKWATGRTDVPSVPSVGKWKWRGTPLSEPWDPEPQPDPMPFTPFST